MTTGDDGKYYLYAHSIGRQTCLISAGERQAEEAFVREQLRAIGAEHWRQFVAAWA